jgi:hypothetical protein
MDSRVSGACRREGTRSGDDDEWCMRGHIVDAEGRGEGRESAHGGAHRVHGAWVPCVWVHGSVLQAEGTRSGNGRRVVQAGDHGAQLGGAWFLGLRVAACLQCDRV